MDRNPPHRPAIWLLTLVAIAASLGFLAMRLVGPSDGTQIPFYAGAWMSDGVTITAPDASADGLRSGDVVTAIDGRSVAAWLDVILYPGVDRSALDAPSVMYAVMRNGVEVDVPVDRTSHPVAPLILEYWSAVVFVVVLQLVAALVLWRRPQAPAAVALALVAVGVSGSTVPWFLGSEVGDLARAAPFLLYAATAGGIYMLVWPAGALHLPLALTSAAPPARRTLALVYGAPLCAYLVALIGTRLATPSWLAWVAWWPVAQGLVIVPTLVVGIGLTARGYLRAPAALRNQLRWAVIGGGIAVVASLALLFVPQLALGSPFVPWSAIGLISLPLPLGIGAAILRYRLFDIEVIVNRALVYGGATAIIVTIYVIVVALVGRLLGVRGELSAGLLATGIAAALALPARDALQRVVNRLMYGDRDDPYRGLDRLGQRLEAAIDPQDVPAVIVRTVAESLRLPWVALRIGADGATSRTIEHGRRQPGEPIDVPLVHGSEIVGGLLVAPRSPTEPLSAADRALLEALARQAGAAVRALGLTLELVESRARLVAAREEERRRIRRDLHDGLGPTLAAIGLRAELAGDLGATDPERARAMLEELRAEASEAIGEVRRLVDALRPPALDELGLVGALQAQSEHLGVRPAIEVTAPAALPELPAAIEVAAYRVAVEAMTNAARHSGGRICRVRLEEVGSPDHALEIEVTDDGRGLPARAQPGIGLASMRTRAAEVGGSCAVASVPSGGTRVFARLPLDHPSTVPTRT
jgi:signal transduction histidine kinase